MQKGQCGAEGCAEGLSLKRSLCAEGLSAKRSLRGGVRGGSECKKISVRRECTEGLSAKRSLRGGVCGGVVIG